MPAFVWSDNKTKKTISSSLLSDFDVCYDVDEEQGIESVSIKINEFGLISVIYFEQGDLSFSQVSRQSYKDNGQNYTL